MRTLWDDPQFNEKIKLIFSKPDVLNVNAQNEFDKFISQPLNTLAYAHVIGKQANSGRNVYFLNENIGILRYIAHRPEHAYNFLCAYLKKTLADSGLWSNFENFFSLASQNKVQKTDFKYLKDTFSNFTIQNTRINKPTEPARIFTKIINPLACERGTRGTLGGFLSPNKITYSELLYNRINFRDVDKSKDLTREEYDRLLKHAPAVNYYISKAKRQVRERHLRSEVIDGSELTESTEIHHIFMQHERPELAGHLENLINLTSNQHRNKAHPKSNFNHVDPKYQKICLLSKCDAVNESEIRKDSFYSKSKLIEVMNLGFSETIFEKNISFKEIKIKLDNLYLERYKVL